MKHLTGIGNEEQLVRWVVEDMVPHEDYIGLYPLERTRAEEIVNVIKNVLITMANVMRARVICLKGKT